MFVLILYHKIRVGASPKIMNLLLQKKRPMSLFVTHKTLFYPFNLPATAYATPAGTSTFPERQLS